MSTPAYLLIIVDTTTFSLAGVDIFSEAEPTLGAHRTCGILLEVMASTYDEAHLSLVHEIATFRRWAWTLPHLGRCKGEVESVLAGRGAFIAPPAPPLETCPPLPPSQSVTDRAATPAKGSYQLVELVDTKFRVVAWVTPSAPGGFIFEEVRADGGHGEAHYVGPSAVYQMWPCGQDVAFATAEKLGSRAADLPSWAALPPTVAPLPELCVGQYVRFDGWTDRAKIEALITPTCMVVRDPKAGVIGIDLADDRHRPALRWISSPSGTVLWERTNGLYDTDELPF